MYLIVAKKSNSENQMVSLNKKTDLKLRGKFKNDTDLSEKVANLYNFINEDELTNEFNSIHASLREGDIFNLKTKDVNDKLIEFTYVEEKMRQNTSCKIISYFGTIQLSEKDNGSNVKLEFCNVEGQYQLAAISLI